MHPAIITCSAIMFIGAIIAFVAFLEDFYDGLAVGIVIMLADLLIGFGIVCSGIAIKEIVTIERPQEIAKSETTLFVKHNGQTMETGEHSFFIANEKDIMVKIVQGKNAWGEDVNSPTYSIFVSNEILERKE